MTDEGRIRLARARHRVKQESQERHFSDKIVLNMKRAYEIRREQYESEIKQLKNKNDELMAKIDKMKCCENCNNFKHRIDDRCNTECKNLSKWELKE